MLQRWNAPRASLGALLGILVVFCGAPGCGDDDDNDGTVACPETTLDLAVCDLSAGPFSTTIDNTYFPLPVGATWVLEGEDDEGAALHLEITVPDETEDVGGVTARVMVEREEEDGELVEVSRNYFAQAPDGTVCYFGEAVDLYEGGEIVGSEGAWRADEGENQPGIIMPADPQVGDVAYQEVAPGVAEDIGAVVAAGVSVSVPAGTYEDAVEFEDCNPLEDGARDTKIYAPGVGLVVDDVLELVGFQSPARGW